MKTIGYTRTKFFIPLIPVSSTIFSVIIYKEKLEGMQIVGILVTIIATIIILSERTKK